jgi:hypothetical protein
MQICNPIFQIPNLTMLSCSRLVGLPERLGLQELGGAEEALPPGPDWSATAAAAPPAASLPQRTTGQHSVAKHMIEGRTNRKLSGAGASRSYLLAGIPPRRRRSAPTCGLLVLADAALPR